MQGLIPPDRCARNLSNARHPAGTQTLGEGLYAAPFLGMETRHGFGAAGWVLSGSEQLLSFIMIKHTHGGARTAQLASSAPCLILGRFRLARVQQRPREPETLIARNAFLRRFKALFLAPKYGGSSSPSYTCVGCRWCHFGGLIWRSICFNFFNSGTALGSINADVSRGLVMPLLVCLSS